MARQELKKLIPQRTVSAPAAAEAEAEPADAPAESPKAPANEAAPAAAATMGSACCGNFMRTIVLPLP